MRVILGFLVCAGVLVAKEVTPELTDEVIFNPGVGWQMLVSGGTGIVRRALEEMPLISTFYYRTSWTRFEPAPGAYENSPAVRTIEGIRRLVKEKGRFFAFRVVTYNARGSYLSGGPKVHGCTTAVPPYVYEELGAEGFEEPGGSKNWVPVFWDPVYIERFNKLAEYLGRRFGGDPNLAYVDIGGGNWGEMNLRNTGIPELDNLSVWREHGLTPDSWHNMIVKLVDGYRAAFPYDYIIIARDYASYGRGEETVRYAVSKKVGFRDDGLGMAYQTAGKRNREFQRYWKEVPCLFENGYVDWTDASGPGWGSEEAVRSTIRWAIEECHACIVMVGKGEGTFRAYRRFEHLIKEFGKKLGYRLAVVKASYADPARPGATWKVNLLWQNMGNSPPYRDYAVEVALVRGLKAYYRYIVPAEQARTSRWLPEAPITMSLSLQLPRALPSGRYALTVALCRPDRVDDVDFRLNLAHKTTDQFKRALVGEVEVRAGGLKRVSGAGEAPSPEEPSRSFPELERLLRQNRYAEALARMDELGEEVPESLRQQARDGKRLLDVVALSGQRLKGRRITVTFAGMRTRGRLIEATAGNLKVSVAGTTVDVAYSDITPRMLAALAGDLCPTHLRRTFCSGASMPLSVRSRTPKSNCARYLRVHRCPTRRVPSCGGSRGRRVRSALCAA